MRRSVSHKYRYRSIRAQVAENQKCKRRAHYQPEFNTRAARSDHARLEILNVLSEKVGTSMSVTVSSVDIPSRGRAECSELS